MIPRLNSHAFYNASDDWKLTSAPKVKSSPFYRQDWIDPAS